MKNPFEANIRSKLESSEGSNNIDALIEEFPEELQDRLHEEIDEMDDQSAEDYLVEKLIARRESLVEWSVDKISKFVEITHDVPLAVIESIERASTVPDEEALGEGKNGRVYQSVRKEYACYKVLFLERARELKVSIVREAVLQHDMSELAKAVPNGAKIPEVLGFVEHPDVLAIMMQKVEGNSFRQIFEGKGELPRNFDIESFFTKLENTINYLNENGFYHRDLTHQKDPVNLELTANSGNVMVDKEGNPWLIDFGSAVKAFSPDIKQQTYTLHPNGGRIRSYDLAGIHLLKEQVIEYIKTNGVQ